jgi:Rho termination factor, N-terminal domain
MRRLLGLAVAATVLGAVWVLIRDVLAEREGDGAGGNGAGGQSKAELYREAQRLEVEGRSKMTKDELAAAISAARRRSVT